MRNKEADQRTVDKQQAAVILLAAGSSSRMGQPKQTLDWLGMPMVQYQVTQLLKVDSIGQIVVVLGYQADHIAPLIEAVGEKSRTRVLVNLEYVKGKTTSVRAGLKGLQPGFAAVVVLAADQPRTSRVFGRLLEAHFGSESAVSIPSFNGRLGHPPVFRSDLLPELLAITEAGEGVREVIRRHEDGLNRVEIDDPLVVTNLNTLEDYQEALALARRNV